VVLWSLLGCCGQSNPRSYSFTEAGFRTCFGCLSYAQWKAYTLRYKFRRPTGEIDRLGNCCPMTRSKPLKGFRKLENRPGVNIPPNSPTIPEGAIQVLAPDLAHGFDGSLV
jgi:hypothetical protein